MNIKLNQKIIIDMCGTVSFKRGDSFFHADKVRFESYRSDRCQAIVAGGEEFRVTIEKGLNGQIHTKCSCPKLASFDQDCQHIAAVLIALYEHQRQGTVPVSAHSADKDLTAGFLNLFKEKPVRSSGVQNHFENRQMIDAAFTLKPVTIGKGRILFGMEIKLGTVKVQNIRGFLQNIKEGVPFSQFPFIVYDQNHTCFSKEAEAVMQELIQVMEDEKVYSDTLPDKKIILIPPTSWEHLLQKLMNTPMVNLEYDCESKNTFHLTEESLPLQFDLTKNTNNDYFLTITCLDQIVVLDSYSYVYYGGKLKKLKREDCKRLIELKQMLDDSQTNQILISQAEIGMFLEKIIPGLKQLGEVHISKAVSAQFMKSPLKSKLYLDRVSNRLLAGLEFHYDNIIINPLESRDVPGVPMLIRDVEKEEEILKLIEESELTKTDEGFYLHNEELEYEFLYHILPKLEKLVQIYATTAVRNRIFRGNSIPKVKVKVKKERINWLEFKFEMDGIPEKQIREVLAALEEKRKYYRLRNGSLLSLETKEMEEIKRFLYSPYVKDKDLINGLKLPIEKCLQLLDTVEESNVFKLEESFHQFMNTLRNPGSLEYELPKSLAHILRDYQKTGFKWMKILAHYGFGGILADDMGLGKTVQSIAYIMSELPEIRKYGLSVLIVCPSSLTYNWFNEIYKFAPELQAIVIDGNKRIRTKLQNNSADMDIIITSYPLLRRDIKWFEKQFYSTVFFDEAQAFKNPLTQTARAVKKLQAHHRFALTGTPVENSLEELWSIFHVVFPELFRGLKEYSHLSKKLIARKIRPFLLRRLKEDVLSELPEKIESVEAVELFSEQKKLYAAYLAKLRHDTLKHLDKDTIRKNRIKILAGITRLRQICCHPGLFVEGYKGSSAKLEQLLQITEDSMHAGRRVLIFSQFTKMLELIGRELTKKGQSFFYLDGQTPSEERVVICDRFNNGERDLFLISLKAGGTGLNLMSADTVILYDTWWNPAVEEQAADRAHRMGQQNVVQVIKLVARGTIEEKMKELQEKKKHLITEIIDTEESIVSALTDEDLREILMM